MDRRQALAFIGSMMLTNEIVAKEDLHVVSYTLHRNKLHQETHGKIDVNYHSDTIFSTLSNGHIVENWIDQREILNTSWKHWEENLPFSVFEADADVAENFARKFFHIED